MTALSLFLPRYQAHPLVQRYALRVLQEFPAENVLFYTPQVVQALRFDQRGTALAQPPRSTRLASPLN